MIDTHSHLYSDQFDEDRTDIINECKELGIKKILLPNIDSGYTEAMLQLEAENPDYCHAMMGIHPCSVQENYLLELDHAKSWLNKRPFIAIGEIGIDLYWDKSTLAWQQEAFKTQISWAIEKKLPIVIHARDAFPEIFDIVDKMHCPDLKGVFHCFSGNLADARHIAEYGTFKMGIGGVVTFKNGGLDQVLPHFDLSHFVLETDSPYLAPAPYRGKRNKSSYLPIIAKKMAEIYDCDIEQIIKSTTTNAKEIFNLV